MAELFVADEIKKLKELLDSGALTEAEFTELKQQVIRKATSGKQESFQETVTSNNTENKHDTVYVNGSYLDVSRIIGNYDRRKSILDAENTVIYRTGCSRSEAKKIVEEILVRHGRIACTKKSAPQNNDQEEPVRCPKCNSTAVVTGTRGYNWFWGFQGSGETVNRCSKCGYFWKPKLPE